MRRISKRFLKGEIRQPHGHSALFFAQNGPENGKYRFIMRVFEARSRTFLANCQLKTSYKILPYFY
jgi:hypothetical protein